MSVSKLECTPTYERMPSYLHLAEEAFANKQNYISGTEIADILGLSSIQVRKDFSLAGLTGIPKRGYKTADLISGIRTFLTWDIGKRAILIGVGNLGKAIALHDEFKNYGLEIIALFDNNKKKIGKKVGQFKIDDISQLQKKFSKLRPSIAILTLSYQADVQELASLLVELGIQGIWNFTKKKIIVGNDVAVYNADLTSGFAVLCADMQRRQ